MKKMTYKGKTGNSTRPVASGVVFIFYIILYFLYYFIFFIFWVFGFGMHLTALAGSFMSSLLIPFEILGNYSSIFIIRANFTLVRLEIMNLII